jgi:hypothetical protein
MVTVQLVTKEKGVVPTLHEIVLFVERWITILTSITMDAYDSVKMHTSQMISSPTTRGTIGAAKQRKANRGAHIVPSRTCTYISSSLKRPVYKNNTTMYHKYQASLTSSTLVIFKNNTTNWWCGFVIVEIAIFIVKWYDEPSVSV